MVTQLPTWTPNDFAVAGPMAASSRAVGGRPLTIAKVTGDPVPPTSRTANVGHTDAVHVDQIAPHHSYRGAGGGTSHL